jgi:hypothetical protein
MTLSYKIDIYNVNNITTKVGSAEYEICAIYRTSVKLHNARFIAYGRQSEIHRAELFVPKPSAFDVTVEIKK